MTSCRHVVVLDFAVPLKFIYFKHCKDNKKKKKQCHTPVYIRYPDDRNFTKASLSFGENGVEWGATTLTH